MFYQPKKGHPFSIDPYKSLIFPRPIGWISSISKKGIPNLAPYSYFNALIGSNFAAASEGKIVAKKVINSEKQEIIIM